MSQRVLKSVGGFVVAISLVAAPLHPWLTAVAAQAPEAKPADQQQSAASRDAAKVEEYLEAQRVLNGPAGNPECVRLGRQIVALLWNNDIDTAFRHLDLYDRFGCPAGHVQAAFRCILLHPPLTDPKPADQNLLEGRANACWLNPAAPVIATPAPPPAPGAAPAAAAPNPAPAK